jgi:hypothetical protein
VAKAVQITNAPGYLTLCKSPRAPEQISRGSGHAGASPLCKVAVSGHCSTEAQPNSQRQHGGLWVDQRRLESPGTLGPILLCKAPGRRAPITKVSDSTRAAVAASDTPVFTATTAVATVKPYLYDKTHVSGHCSTEAQTNAQHPARGPLGRFKNSLESPRARESHTIGRKPPGAEAPTAKVRPAPGHQQQAPYNRSGRA